MRTDRGRMEAFKRAFTLRCPRCGKASIYEGWMVLVSKCPSCGTSISDREDDTWFFMYMTTAALTGVFILGMLFITPRNVPLARVLVAVFAMVLFFVSQPLRKSIAISLEYYVDSHSEFPKHQD